MTKKKQPSHDPHCSMHGVPAEDIEKRIVEMIANNIAGPTKFHIFGIFGTETTPSFVYTVGVTDILGYELLAFSLPQESAMHIFNDFVGAKPEIKFGENDPRWANLDTRFYRATDPRVRQYVRWADRWYEKDVDVVQLVIPDTQGRFFDDEKYDHAHMDKLQLVLA